MTKPPQDDNRSFWLFTAECEHAIGVVTNKGYSRSQAFRQMYGGVKGANAAIDRNVQARLVDAVEYYDTCLPQLLKGCTCPR